MAYCSGFEELEQDVHGESSEICQYLAVESNGCDNQYQGKLRRITRRDGYCSTMGHYSEADFDRRITTGSWGPFQDLPIYICSFHHLVDGR